MDNDTLFDRTDLADWELSVEVELTIIAVPSLDEDCDTGHCNCT